MFTGIIQEIGSIEALDVKPSLLSYAVKCSLPFLEGIIEGASVSVDGVCQTVVKKDKDLLFFDAIEETLRCTTLSAFKLHQKVNIERSAKLGDEIGGHLLSGHIFGKGQLASIQDNSYTFLVPLTWIKYFLHKGFIAIDGMSLTLGEIDKIQGLFSVHLIPETLKRTTIGQKKVGDFFNIEIDARTQAIVDTVEAILKDSYLR